MAMHLSKDIVYYLATPYSHACKYTQECRYLDTLWVAARLVQEGITLIEPIAMSHQQAQRFGLPSSFEFWRERDHRLIECVDEVLVCMLEGWDQSVGVLDEIDYAAKIGKRVSYLDPVTLEVSK